MRISSTAFHQRLVDRKAVIGVIGLGYVGLPLAMAFAEAGFEVRGVDTSQEKVGRLRSGVSYVLDVPSEALSAVVASGRLTPTTDVGVLAEADVLFICVPTPFDLAKIPDLGDITAAATSIAGVLRPGQLIILESTTYPGTTEEVLVPILARSGLVPGHDFHVAFSPERMDPGNKDFRIGNTPKVVGGMDAESTERASVVLEQIVDPGKVHRVSTPRAAELTKLLENTFRAVNIALVNELTMLCDRMGIDVWEVIDAAKTKPYGFMAFSPGTGVGGHCIPVDPHYLAWKAREYDFSTRFIDVAAETNQEMPYFTVQKLRRLLRMKGVSLDGARILVIGAAFKRDIDDARNSPAIRVMEVLRQEGAIVSYHDPHVPEIDLRTARYGGRSEIVKLRSCPLTDERISDADCVAILVAHAAVDLLRVVDLARFVFDAVNATSGMDVGVDIARL